MGGEGRHVELSSFTTNLPRSCSITKYRGILSSGETILALKYPPALVALTQRARDRFDINKRRATIAASSSGAAFQEKGRFPRREGTMSTEAPGFSWTKIAWVVLFPLAILAPPAASGIDDKCLTGTAPVVAADASQIRAARILVDTACNCSTFDGSRGRKRGNYRRCAASVIRAQIDAGTLRSRCYSTVKKYYAKATCGTLPELHAQPCVQRSLTNGKLKCVVRSTTRRDGTTPTNSCTDRPGRVTRMSCPAYTHCIDAADTDGNLIIAAPGDTGSCAPLPTPTPTACTVDPSAGADLEENRAKWVAAGIDTYDIDYQRSCACSPPNDVTVLVTNGGITSVVDSGTGEEVVNPPTGAYGFNSVDGLFDVIATAIAECAASLDVQYDPELGYPTSVDIDFIGGTVGDEVELHVNDLHVAAIATFPIAVGACLFDPQCMDQSCMPSVSAAPSPESNVAWTGFFEAASTAQLLSYFPPECAGGGITPRVRVGDVIHLVNGQSVPLLSAVECIVATGQTIFTVPVIPCDPAAQSNTVVDSVKIQIDDVVTSGTPKGISFHALYEN
jgi:hypothetical protein